MAGAGVGAVEQGSSADARARDTEGQMTDEERFSLLVSVIGVNDVVTVRDERIPEGVPMSAGYVPGVTRLGIPALLMSDASLGVTNPGYRPGDTATALPAGIALGASFNPVLARASRVGCSAGRRGAGDSMCSWRGGSTSPEIRGTGGTSSTCRRTRC